MTDTQSSQMGRGKNARRNKSTSSMGTKKGRSSSTSAIKFQANVDGYHAFLAVVSRLGRHGQEFTWHDIRKVYHRETQRVLTAEELSAIFSAKNLTKREIFELPVVKHFMESMDSMMCRFRLIADPEEVGLRHDDLPPLMTASVESDVITNSSSSPDPSQIDEKSKSIAISTDCEMKTGPTSDLSKSEISSPRSLIHQASVQSAYTDDEGWASGRETRSDNSSPLVSDEPKRKSVELEHLEDEVFENEQRIAAGSDQVDGAVVSDLMVVDQVQAEHVFRPADCASPILVTDSIDAAFEAVQSLAHARKVLPYTRTATASETVPLPAARSAQPIKKLIEKFDTPVNFTEHKSPSKSIYAQVLEEIGEREKQPQEEDVADVSNVIFRTASTHSSILAQGKEQLAEFVAEQEAKQRESVQTRAETSIDENDGAFAAREQSSMSSLDREYFDLKTMKHGDLFAELGVQDTDGFQLAATQQQSSESAPPSEEVITVIEKTIPQVVVDEVADKDEESDADVPYSLCSEDEAEPMTMIDKSMKVSSASAEQLSPPPKEESKPKTVVVNVELDAKKKHRDVDVSVKERIAALQAAVAKKSVPIAKVDSVEEDVQVLNRCEELEHSVLHAKPAEQATNSDGSMRRRQVRFMRGCCVVQ